MDKAHKNSGSDSHSEKLKPKSSKVKIILDSYHDIFSDFDPSDYSERTLSHDFILQAKNILSNKGENKKAIHLLIPTQARDGKVENAITNRIHSHFKDAHQEAVTEVKEFIRKGIILTIIGAFLMVIASYISFIKVEKYYYHLLFVLFEPAGWFLLWTGLENLVYSSRKNKKDLKFYYKMTKSEILFLPY